MVDMNCRSYTIIYLKMAASMVYNRLPSVIQNVQVGLLAPCLKFAAINLQCVRHRRTKHWDPKFKKLRSQKVIKVDLRDWTKTEAEGGPTADEARARMKERGVVPPRPWMERAFFIGCTGGTFEPYVPPEGDGHISVVSVPGAKQKFELLEKKSKSMIAVRKIRSFDEDFETKDFVVEAAEIYKKAHEYMASGDKVKLREVVTERAYPELRHNVHLKTIQWKFLEWLEPPKFTHARCTDVITKDNIFGQITVRFHSQQLLAIYDRFGRLMHGSETIPKDVLEYVVFEKHLSNQYGIWRLHDKIIPEWMPPRPPATITYVKKEAPPVEPESPIEETKAITSESESGNKLATI